MAGYAPDSKTLAATGGAGLIGMSMEQSMTMAGMIILSGGALMTAAKFGPRLAIEPRYDFVKNKQRMQMTYNGRPLFRRNNQM